MCNPVRPEIAPLAEGEGETLSDVDDVVSIGEGEGSKVEEGREEAAGEEEEALRPKALRDPGQPSQWEMIEHRLTHLPPRPWCKYCMFGRAQHDQHRAVVKQDPSGDEAIPCISLDYCFMGNRNTIAKRNPILVVFDNRTGSLGAWQTFEKGPVDWVVGEVTKFIDNLGYSGIRITLKSDNEVSITSLKTAIAARRVSPTVPIESPAKESKSNGAMEARIKSWQSQFRAQLMDLQDCLGCRIPLGNKIVSWLVTWSATCLNKFKVDSAGRTAYQRVTGKTHNRPLAQFGESVWWIPNGPREIGTKAETRVKEGVFLGLRSRTNESILGTPDGVFAARTVRRRPDSERWQREVAMRLPLSVSGNVNNGEEPEAAGGLGGGQASGQKMALKLMILNSIKIRRRRAWSHRTANLKIHRPRRKENNLMI